MTDAMDDGDLRALSAAVRADWRAEEEEWTRAAFEHWEHGRMLIDIARECMNRGDIVTLETPHAVVRGVIGAVGRDTLRVADGEELTDFHLISSAAIVLRVVGRARVGGKSGSDGSATFRARLLERETIPAVELGTFTQPGVLAGELRVGGDHVRVRSAEAIDAFVPMPSVAWVRAGRF